MIKKFNNILEENILKLFTVFLVSIPVLDALLGLFKISVIDYAIKLIFTGIFIYYLMIIDKKYRKYIFIIFIYSIIFTLINGYFKEGADLIYEIKVLLKVIYFPIILLFVLTIKDKVDMKYSVIMFIIYVTLILVPNILHIGHNSYAITKEGSVGFYISANVIGNILSMLYPIFIIFLVKIKRIPALIIFTCLYLYTILTMGTKGPLICITILFLYYFIYAVIYLIKEKKYKVLIAGALFIGIIFLVAVKYIPTTAFYKNLLTHLEFLNIHSFKDFLTLKNIDHFIFGSRFTMLKDSLITYKNSSLLHILFGIGYTNNGALKTCEMDYFVLLIHNGIIGFMIIYSVYFALLIKIIKNYFKDFKTNFMDIYKSSLFIAVLITILCAFFVGHTLDEPSASILVSIILVLCDRK